MNDIKRPVAADPGATTEQVERFKQAARDLDCNEDEGRWDATLKKIARQKPAPVTPE